MLQGVVDLRHQGRIESVEFFFGILPAIVLDEHAGGAAEMAAVPAASDPAASIADTKWQGLFADQTLNQTVTTSLAHNFDLRIAVERVQQARAQLGIARANKYPIVDIGGFQRGA